MTNSHGSYIVLFCVLMSLGLNNCTQGHMWDYIIVGAGPAGLQMGYFLHKAGRNYVILERNNVAGSFFNTYPRHERLISINKRFTGKSNREFNLRHDWNSLLSEDENMLFKYFSKDYFPHRQNYSIYLSEFAKRFQLNIKYNTDVRNIKNNESYGLVMEDQDGLVYKCKTLLIGTGMWKPNIPNIDGIEHTVGYESVSIDPDDFEGKSVLILGKGNTAFETASAIYGSANLVHLVSRSRVRLSWQTHYVGDLRGVNNEVLDTYQLKSLDGLLEGPLRQLQFRPQGNKLEVALRDNITWDNYALRENYDVVIRCLGWVFDDLIFTNNTAICNQKRKLSKFPAISGDYKLKSLEGVYVIGTAAHSLDFRKSSGGFIHGFRYIVRVLHQMLEYKNHGVKWPSTTVRYIDLVSTVIKRVNEASGLYQMFGVLVDVIALNRSSQTAEFFKEYPIQLLPSFRENTGYPLEECIVLILEYGKNFSGPNKDVFYKGRAVGQASRAHKSNFLHPVFYYYKNIQTKNFSAGSKINMDLPIPDRLHHTVEDFLGLWDAPHAHILPLRRFIEYCTDSDLRSVFNSLCFKIALTGDKLPLGCSEYYIDGHGLSYPDVIL